MRVLILDGNENQAVACVRSLARAGHTVVVGADTNWSKAGWSRYCAETFKYPSPQQDAQAFVERVAEETARVPGTLVLPLTERATLPLSEARAQITSVGGRMVLPSHDALLRAFDKQQTTELAQQLGIAVPQTFLINDAAEARELAEKLPFPLVLKPRSSEEINSTGQVLATGAPLYAADAREFLAAYAQLKARSSSVLAQEFIEGAGGGYFALMHEGELRAEFAHRRLRDVRPTGSGSALRVSIEPAPELRQAALSILRALKWHGVAMVEFRVRADGTPVFLEVNGRFWNSLALAVYAGADFPALLAQMAEHGDVPASTGFNAGVRCRWLLGDFRHLLEVWRGKPSGYPGEFPNRWRTLLSFCAPVRNTFHDNFTVRDPLPEVGDWLDFAFRRLPAGLRKRSASRKDVHVQRGYSLP